LRFSGKLLLAVATLATAGTIAAYPTEASAACSRNSGGFAPGSCTTSAPKGTKARLVRGKAVAPRNAPRAVKRVIAAANRIEDKPYRYGGGHGRWNDSGYDCSGSVSYALHGGGLLGRAMASAGFMRWGRRGRGRWITIYANRGHVYAVIAGLRWDTSMTPGNGPGWSKRMRSSRGFAVRHPRRF
jgi:cell wall-associated NlpC family hydrolase